MRQSFFLKQMILFSSWNPMPKWKLIDAVFVSSQSLANSAQPFSLAHCSHSDASFLAILLW
nr:hypothetical protein [Slackia heliotrinireducens]